jgi:hypothetical protein
MGVGDMTSTDLQKPDRQPRATPIQWDEERTAKLVRLDRARKSYAQIAAALGVPEPRVRSKIYVMRGRGELDRRPPIPRARRPAVPVDEQDPMLAEEVIELREEGLTREEIVKVTGASQTKLGHLLQELARAKRLPRVVSTGRRAEPRPEYVGARELLTDDEVRDLHAQYEDGQRNAVLADRIGVRTHHLYLRYKELKLPTRATASLV